MTHPRRDDQQPNMTKSGLIQWRSKLGRPGKEDRAMVDTPRIKTI
jgi:hypothetical protein